MKKKLRVMLVQLPVPHIGLVSNVLWAGYLKAMAHKEGLLRYADIDIFVETLNQRDIRILSDSGLVETIVSRRPDMIGFSLNCGMSKRSLYIAGEVKKRLAGLMVIVGGPEVSPDSGYIQESPAVDIGVIGDGEAAFCEILRHVVAGNDDYSDIRGIFYRAEGRVLVNERREKLQDLNDVPSPYLLGFTEPGDYEMIWLENMRGCKRRCTYCLSAGSYAGYFSPERIYRELKIIAEKGIREVGLCDTCFISSPNFYEVCERIKEIRKKYDLRFYTCVHTDHLTPEKADLLKECGFYTIEVGLQSANAATLKEVGRINTLDRLVKGIKLLEERGIQCVIDTIVGLPGDTLESFKRTLRMLRENDLNTRNLHAFQLRLFPGIQLRKEAAERGIRYKNDPPYEIIDAPYISSEEIREALLLAAGKFRRTFSGSFSSYCQSEYPRKHAKGGGRTGEGERFNKVVIEL
ncbi:MAG: B12-binding domain-containing radical SAM protein, partial [Endomicrobiales bacterium]